MQTPMSQAFLPQQAALCHNHLGSLTSAGVAALMATQAASTSNHLSQIEAVLMENKKLLRENETLQRENELLRRELECYNEKANRIQKVKTKHSSTLANLSNQNICKLIQILSWKMKLLQSRTKS